MDEAPHLYGRYLRQTYKADIQGRHVSNRCGGLMDEAPHLYGRHGRQTYKADI